MAQGNSDFKVPSFEELVAELEKDKDVVMRVAGVKSFVGLGYLICKDLLDNDTLFECLAKLLYKAVIALEKEGFSREEAIHVVTALSRSKVSTK